MDKNDTVLPPIRVHDFRHPYVKPTTKKYSCKSKNPGSKYFLIAGDFCAHSIEKVNEYSPQGPIPSLFIKFPVRFSYSTPASLVPCKV